MYNSKGLYDSILLSEVIFSQKPPVSLESMLSDVESGPRSWSPEGPVHSSCVGAKR